MGAGRRVLNTGFRLGHGGICGPAIYFSPTAKDTDVKAVGGRGFIIEARVDMGRMKTMSGQCDNTLTASKMQASQYDSITLDRGGYAECWFLPHCYEYIIYDPKRVVSMKGYPYNGWNSWFPAPKWPGWPAMQLHSSAKTSEGATKEGEQIAEKPKPTESTAKVAGTVPNAEAP